MNILTKKYVSLERNKRRNARLAEWQGTMTNDFTGTEAESKSIKSKIKP